MPIQVKKELEIIRKKEEKIVFRVGRFKVRRKLFFSILLSVLVAVMTFNKVRVLHESGQSISNIMLAITSLVCFVSLYLAIIR
ncbi:MAG: hypothetical protein KKE20_06615, partial [Nanoarchaeota archaeon]|nr:hypothetical protein [Nanoarchaeota archaeon]